MISTIYELPSEVRDSFDEEDCRIFLDEFNQCNPKNEEETQEAYKKAWRKCKTLPSSFSFDIIASVEDVDSDGELITIEALKGQMDDYIKQGGKVQSEHSNYSVGHIWDYDDYTDPDTGYPGIVVHGNVFGGRGENSEYTRARQDFLDGKNNLSIAGDASVEGYECDGTRCFVRRNITQLMEISLVENPANPYARLLWYNDKAIVKNLAKSADEPKDDESPRTSFKVRDVRIHKSYNECDLQGIVRLLKGHDCKVTSKGVIVGIEGDTAEFVDLVKSKIKTLGQVVSVDTDSVTIDANSRILEREFKKSYSNSECDEKGKLTDKVCKGRFIELYSKCIIKMEKDGFYFDGNLLNEGIQ